MKVYIVMGGTGEYSDHKEWVVCCYRDEALAQEHVRRVTEIARSHEAMIKAGDDCFWEHPLSEATREWDPNAKCDYTGTRYYIETADIRDALPKGDA